VVVKVFLFFVSLNLYGDLELIIFVTNLVYTIYMHQFEGEY